jgi:hypothetical protein
VYAIDYKTVQAATLCSEKHCLEGAAGGCCAVSHCVMDRILLIDCAEDKSCPYKQDFDGGHVCTCPVRKEIFSRYGD